jgi:hypothetical protein
MPEQRWLAFIEEEGLEGLWEGFPEPARREVTQRYARLMAQMLAARVRKATGVQEASDEPNDK